MNYAIVQAIGKAKAALVYAHFHPRPARKL